MSARLVVVSGTGTNVGKTHVACALTAAFARAGAVTGLKPFESGHEGPLGSDQVALAACSTHAAASLGFPLRCFPLPVAPPEAARAAGKTVSSPDFLRALGSLRASYTGTIVLELAGGLFSPFDDDRSNADVLLAAAPDAHLLVAPNRLGVLHDVRATLLAARALGLALDALVLSHPPGSGDDASCASNPAALARVFGAEPLVVPRGDVGEATDVLRAALDRGILQRRSSPRRSPR